MYMCTSSSIATSDNVFLFFLARRISNCRRKRRGSIQSIAPSQRFHNVAVLQTIGVEEEHKTLQVIYMCTCTGYVVVVTESFCH